jgi:hypothetical protein
VPHTGAALLVLADRIAGFAVLDSPETVEIARPAGWFGISRTAVACIGLLGEIAIACQIL